MNDGSVFWHPRAFNFGYSKPSICFFFIWLLVPKREVVHIHGQVRRIGHDPTGARGENNNDQMGLVPPHILCIPKQIRKQVLQVDRRGSK